VVISQGVRSHKAHNSRGPPRDTTGVVHRRAAQGFAAMIPPTELASRAALHLGAFARNAPSADLAARRWKFACELMHNRKVSTLDGAQTHWKSSPRRRDIVLEHRSRAVRRPPGRGAVQGRLKNGKHVAKSRLIVRQNIIRLLFRSPEVRPGCQLFAAAIELRSLGIPLRRTTDYSLDMPNDEAKAMARSRSLPFRSEGRSWDQPRAATSRTPVRGRCVSPAGDQEAKKYLT